MNPRRRVALGALALSLLLHVFGGGILAWLARLMPAAPPAHDDEASATVVAIERLTPTPLPTASPTPVPTASPTPPPTPTPRPQRSAAPAVPRLAMAPHPRRRNSAVVALSVPQELARSRPHASPQPPRAPAAHGYTSSQLATMESQFRSTIASAQRAAAEGPPQSGGYGRGRASTTKRYDAVGIGTPADELGGGGVCDNLSEETRGERTYVYWRCRVRYSDGYTEVVVFPWPFAYPRGHVPHGRETFPAQPPRDGFQLPQVFALSRQVCAYYRSRCDAVLAKERAEGAPEYGTPP